MNATDVLPGLRLGLPFGAWAASLFAAALLVLVVLGVREHRTLAEAWRRRALDALRCATALAALLLVAQPQWVREQVEHVQGRIAILLDVSRSMSVREGQHTRLQDAVALVKRSFDSSAQKPSLYVFGDEASPITRAALDDANLPMRDDTRIAHSLRSLVDGQASDLGAVLLVTDGADRDTEGSSTGPGTASGAPVGALSLTTLGVQVHSVAIGGSAALHDVSIESSSADAVAFLRQPAQVQVRVRAPRDHEKKVTVTLRRGPEVLREVDVELDPEGIGTTTFSFTPTRLGREAYTVAVPTDADDAVPENNERAFLVRVVREKLRILLVCGEPSWDARFLRAFLKNDPAIDLITFFILRTQTDNSMASPEELSLIPFPTEELFEQHLASFDLVIFQDFDFGPYQMARYLPLIRDYVVNGGSFAMLGGARSFGPGGYLGTPIAEVLPVTLVASDQALDEADFVPQLVPEASHHPLAELAPRVADNSAAWSSLSPLVGVNRVAGLSEGSQALLVHPKLLGAHGEPMPVLAVGAPSRGRSMALMTDTSYRWGITTAGKTGDASAYERFWDRALRWLARDPLLDPAQITTDRERYGPGAKLRASLWLRDQSYRVLGQRAFRVSLVDHLGATQKLLPIETDAEGHAALDLLAPSTPGAYTLSVQAEGGPKALADEVFVVEAGGDELADPRARPDVLKRVSAATGGNSYANASELPALDKLSHTRTRVVGTQVVAPCASPWFYALFVALFAVEWWLRRRFGLR